MNVNKIKITLPETSQEIVVPFDMQWDLLNREDTVVSQDAEVIKKVIGTPPNYELVRFSRRPIANQTEQKYQFYFYSATTDTWINSYFTRFTQDDVRFFSNAYKKSFFKLDLYDTTEPQTQRIYLTVILGTYQSAIDFFATLGIEPPVLPCIRYRIISSLPADEELFTYTDCCGQIEEWSREPGQTELVFCAPFGSVANLQYSFEGDLQPPIDFVLDGTNYDVFNNLGVFVVSDTCECDLQEEIPLNSYIIYKPEFNLDHVGNREGYYLYWYEDPTLLNITEFFMKVKFFDGATGTYIVFTTNPQSNYVNRYAVPNDDFYVRVPLIYSSRFYEIVDILNGNILTTCPWYEYVNPPLT
jgi:hypothetical protein